MPDIDYQLDEAAIDVAPKKSLPARDELGRFVADKGTGQADVMDSEGPDGQEMEPEVVPDAEPDNQGEVESGAGLDLDDDALPTFDHDGRFVGGKFLGKYETLDDALQATKAAQREINRLNYELSRLADGQGASAKEVVFDPQALTPEQIDALIDSRIYPNGEMSVEDRIAFEEAPDRFIARRMRQREEIRREILGANEAWERATEEAYLQDRQVKGGVVKGMDPVLYRRAVELGNRTYLDYGARRLGPTELRILIGLGIMARQGMLSGEKTVNRREPVGRPPETAASRATPADLSRRDPRWEQKAALRAMAQARYG